MTGHRNSQPRHLAPRRLCAYCGGTAYTLDHIIPRSRGGRALANNTVDCCFRCNAQKANRTPSEWAAHLPKWDRRRINILLIVDRQERPLLWEIEEQKAHEDQASSA